VCLLQALNERGSFHTHSNGCLVISNELTNNLLKIPSTDVAMNTKIQDIHEETALMVSPGLLFQRSGFLCPAK
jgi:hypothetical protein